jgi:hypothetical protein
MQQENQAAYSEPIECNELFYLALCRKLGFRARCIGSDLNVRGVGSLGSSLLVKLEKALVACVYKWLQGRTCVSSGRLRTSSYSEEWVHTRIASIYPKVIFQSIRF